MEREIKQVQFPTITTEKLKRVAAYARVSNGKDAMLHSLSAQVSEFSSLIQGHPGWSYCGVYADEAMTGTKENRDNFQKMLKECRAGNIDMVITKSISRFARNTVTLLEIIRELKNLGVDVYFQEQNIHTMSADGELMMTILASYAQEESRSASENIKWRIQACFRDGIPWNGTVIGYRIADGTYRLQEEEAEIVRQVYKNYLEEEYGFYKISCILNDAGYRTRRGRLWTYGSVRQVAMNYTYTGNLLLQTTYINNHIEKKSCRNRGQLPMYHAQNTHEAIIPLEEYLQAQTIRESRAKKYAHGSAGYQTYPFTGKLHCMCCGKNYRRKVTKGGVVWICETYNALGKSHCQKSKQIPEVILQRATAQVLGMEVFDADVFSQRIKEVQMLEGNTLNYIFPDGQEALTTWQDHSRADSWTPEMKEAARARELQRRTQHET